MNIFRIEFVSRQSRSPQHGRSIVLPALFSAYGFERSLERLKRWVKSCLSLAAAYLGLLCLMIRQSLTLRQYRRPTVCDFLKAPVPSVRTSSGSARLGGVTAARNSSAARSQGDPDTKE